MNSRKLIMQAASFYCLFGLAFILGCGGHEGGGNPAAVVQSPGETPTAGDAQLSFRIVIPPDWKNTPDAGIRTVTQTATPTVTFSLLLFDLEKVATSTLSKTVEVVNQKAETSFQSLPPWPLVGKALITGGSYANATSFSGCLDLVAGSNIMEISPVGSVATAAYAAYIMEQMARDPVKLAQAPLKLAAAVNTTLAKLTLSNTSLSAALTSFQGMLADSKSSSQVTTGHSKFAELLAKTVKDALMAGESDFSSFTTTQVSSIRAAINIPALPGAPPTVPSGAPTLASTTNIGIYPTTAATKWYLYVPFANPTFGWAEWKTTVSYYSAAVFTSYWRLDPPSTTSSNSQTRSFVGSGWNASGALTIYTIGTGTFQTGGVISASGTQVAMIPVQGVPTLVAYTFDITKQSDESITGTVTLNNGGSINFTAMVKNPAAVGTPATYTQTIGTIYAVTPTVHSLTFSSTLYGDNSRLIVVTTSGGITTSLKYSNNGSGSGSVAGPFGGSISLTWDSTGAAKATVTLGSGTKTVSFSIVPRGFDEAPGN